MTAQQVHHKSGGFAAKPLNLTPNQTKPNTTMPNTTMPNTTMPNTTMPNTTKANSASQPPTTPVTLKEAAATFACALSSLKNNVKSGKLRSTQVSERAPFLVLLSDVEEFLRATPGIASKFHVKDVSLKDEEESAPRDTVITAVQPMWIAAAEETVNVSDSLPIVDPSPTTEPAEAIEEKVDSTEVSAHCENSSVLETTPAYNPDRDRNRNQKRNQRRKRNRGLFGGLQNSGESPDPQGATLSSVQVLAVASPEDKLRIVALLNELARQVALA